MGTVGLATVQLRNVVERRGELALLRAAGFGRARIAWLVMWENAGLLLGGLLVGVVAALFAVVPHMILGDAAIPASDFVRDLTIMLAVVISVGILTGLVAIRVTLNTPLVPALRGE